MKSKNNLHTCSSYNTDFSYTFLFLAMITDRVKDKVKGLLTFVINVRYPKTYQMKEV